MGGSSEMKWSKFTGTITKGEQTGTIELCMDSDPPNWHAFVSNVSKGSQISKFFKQGDLEEAHNWCISTLEKQ